MNLQTEKSSDCRRNSSSHLRPIDAFRLRSISLAKKLICFIFAVLMFIGLLPSVNNDSSNPQAQTFYESQVKAAFLYNFTKFVEWPSEAFQYPDSPIVIGTIGDGLRDDD